MTRDRRFGRRVVLLTIAAASTAVVGILCGPVRAALAPVAAGEGVAIEVRPLDTAVSVAEATAGQESASSDGVNVRLLGEEVGSSSSNSSGTGATSHEDSEVDVALGTSESDSPGHVRVMPRRTSASSSSAASHSSAQSDLVTARIPGLIELEVLSSDAEAVWTPTASSSRAQVDGAKIDLFEGDLVIVLMHAEESSDGRGRLYLIRINDAELFDTDQGGPLTIEVPDIFTIDLLRTNASGGFFTAEVVDVGFDDEPGIDEFADEFEDAIGDDDEDDTVLPESEVEPVSFTGDDAGLPTTGVPIDRLVLYALMLLTVGVALLSARAAALLRT